MRLTYRKRKLLLAAGLMAILGTNLSFDMSRFDQKYSTIELSSELDQSSLEIEEFADEEAQSEQSPKPAEKADNKSNRQAGPSRPANLGKNTEASTEERAESSQLRDNPARAEKIYTSDGYLRVRYLEGESANETLAIVQKTQTEGQTCNDCFETIHLGMSNKEDIEKLNDALMKKLSQSKEAEKTAEQKVAKVETISKSQDAEIEDVKERESIFDRLISKCEEKSMEADRLSCLSDGMISMMKSKNSTITRAEADTFFTTQIQPLLVNQIKEARTKLSSLRSQDQSLDDMLFGPQYDASTRKEFLNEIRKTVETMIAKIPSAYENIRAKVLMVESQVLAMEVSNFHSVNELAKTTTDLNQKTQLQTEAADRLSSTKVLAELLMSSSANGISDASRLGLTDSTTTNIYNKFVQEFRANFLQSLSSPQAASAVAQKFEVPVSNQVTAEVASGSPIVVTSSQVLTTQDGRTVIVLPSGTNMTSRIQAPIRGNLKVAPQHIVIQVDPVTKTPVVINQAATSQPTSSVVVTPQPMYNTGAVLVEPMHGTSNGLAARVASQN